MMEEERSKLAPKATGCLVQSDDIPRICASLSAFGAQFGCGAGTALLGLTFPHFLKKFHLEISNFGPLIFSCAGIGMVLGISLSYHVRQTVSVNLSKISLACLSIFVASLLQLLIMLSDNILLICILYILQFTSFGCVEGFTLIAFFEMWGQRIQPWIFSKSLSFSFGCLILSLFFRNKHFNEIYFLSAIMCLFPLFGLVLDFIYTNIRNKKIRNSSTIINHYSTFQSPSPSAASGYESSPSFQRSTGIAGASPPTALRETIPTILEEDFMSAECVLLELAFDHVKALSSVPHKVKRAVINILDATEYCNVTMQQRKDPYFEPNIIKTLAYATKPIVNKLNDFKMAKKTPPIPIIPPVSSFSVGLLGLNYMCSFTLFIGWIPWYIIEYNQSIYQSNNLYLDHWNVMSLYYACAVIGVAFAIPLSIWISTSTILRLHLTCILLSSILFILFAFFLNDFSYFIFGAMFLGFGLSSMSSSLLTLLNDYGYTCDDFSVTSISICSSLGIIVSSFLISYAVSQFGFHSIPGLSSILGLFFILSYSLFHFTHQSSRNRPSSFQSDQADPMQFKSFNTYQRAQTMLIDRRTIFKFTRSSADLTSLYQNEEI